MVWCSIKMKSFPAELSLVYIKRFDHFGNLSSTKGYLVEEWCLTCIPQLVEICGGSEMHISLVKGQ